MKQPTRLLLSMILMIAVFASCNKDSSLPYNECGVDKYIYNFTSPGDTNQISITHTIEFVFENNKIVSRLDDGDFKHHYHYDDHGALLAIESYYNKKRYVSDSLFFDGENLVKSIKYTVDQTVVFIDDFHWESDKLISAFRTAWQAVNDTVMLQRSRLDYSYSAANISGVKVTHYDLIPDDSLINWRSFMFDDRQNYLSDFSFIPSSNHSLTVYHAPYWYSENNIIDQINLNSGGQWSSEEQVCIEWDDELASVVTTKVRVEPMIDLFVKVMDLSHRCN